MPPKLKIKRTSQNAQNRKNIPHSVPIYQILLDNYSSPSSNISQLTNKLQQIYDNSQEVFLKSVMVFILELCGLSQFANKIDWRQNVEQQLQDVMETMAEQYKNRKNKKKTTKSKKNKQKKEEEQEGQMQLPEFPLLVVKSKLLASFHKNLNKLFKFIISDEIDALSQTQLMKLMFQAMIHISKCKLRNIRASGLELCKIIIQKSCEYYHSLLHNNSSISTKKSLKILTILEDGYLQQLLKPRIKDIDNKIRETSYSILTQLIKKLPNQLLKVSTLQKILLPILLPNIIITNNNNQINNNNIENSLSAMIQMLQVKKQRKCQQQVLQYFNEKIASIIYDTAIQLAYNNNSNSLLCLKLLVKLQKYGKLPKLLTPKQILKLFQVYSNSNTNNTINKQHLQLCIQLFLYSVTASNKKSQLISNKQNIIIQFANLLGGLLRVYDMMNVNVTNAISSNNNNNFSYSCAYNTKVMTDIISIFYNTVNNKDLWVVNCEQLFLLVFSQYYHSDTNQSDIQFHQIQLYVLLHLLIRFKTHLCQLQSTHKNNTKDNILRQLCQKQTNSYNNLISIHIKQLFFDKLPTKSAQLCSLYIQLLSLISTNNDDNSNNNNDDNNNIGHIDFTIQQLLLILSQQKFLVYGREDISIIWTIINNCIQTYRNLVTNNSKIRVLVSALNIRYLKNNSNNRNQYQNDNNNVLDPIQILKLSALSSYYTISQLQTLQFLKLCLSYYAQSLPQLNTNTNNSRLQLLTLFSNIYKQLFSQLMTDPHQQLLNRFIKYRGLLVDMITVIVINQNGDYNNNNNDHHHQHHHYQKQMKNQKDRMVRFGAFGLLMQILKTSGNDSIIQHQLYPIHYQLSSNQLTTLNRYISTIFTQQLHLLSYTIHNTKTIQILIPSQKQQQQQQQQYVKQLLTNLNITNNNSMNTIKNKVLQQLFDVYACNYRLCLQNIDIIVKFVMMSVISQWKHITININNNNSNNNNNNTTLINNITINNNTTIINNNSSINNNNKHQLPYPHAQIFNTITNKLLKQLIKKQGQDINKSKFIFWRLFTEITNLLTNWNIQYIQHIQNSKNNKNNKSNNKNKRMNEHQQEQQQNEQQQQQQEGNSNKKNNKNNKNNKSNKNKQDIIMNVCSSLLEKYLKYKYNTKVLSDKLMVYIADAIDKLIHSITTDTIDNNTTNNNTTVNNTINNNTTTNKYIHNTIKCRVILLILKRVHRRYPKQVLHRLSIFFNNKISVLEQYINDHHDKMDVENNDNNKDNDNNNDKQQEQYKSNMLSALKSIKKYLIKLSDNNNNNSNNRNRNSRRNSDKNSRNSRSINKNSNNRNRKSNNKSKSKSKSKNKNKTNKMKQYDDTSSNSSNNSSNNSQQSNSQSATDQQ